MVVQIGGVAFLDLVGDFIEAACATEDIYGLFEVVLRVSVSSHQIAFATKPAAIAVAHAIDGDGLEKHVSLCQVHGTRRTKRFADRMACRGIHRLLDGQKLVVEFVGTFVTTAHQGINGI